MSGGRPEDVRFRRGLLRAVTAPLALLLLVGGLLVWQIAELREAVEDTYELTGTLRSARDAYRLMVEMELAVRGYQLTGSPALLGAYAQDEAALDRTFGDLQRYAELDPLPTGDVHRLREARQELARYARQAIDARPPRAPDAAPGPALSPALDGVGEAFVTFISTREQLRDTRARHAIDSTARVMWSAGALSVLLGLLLAILVRRQLLSSVGEYSRALRAEGRRAAELVRAQRDLSALAGSLEQRVADRTLRLEEANRDLEAFSYSVSHDLRAPLRSLQAMAESLHEDCRGALPPACADYTLRICRSAERLQALMDDLLRYGRLGRAEIDLAPTSLRKAVDEALAQLAADLEARGARVVVDDPLPDVMATWAILVQVIANLISNGVKFVEGKRPEVRLRAEPPLPGHEGRVRLWVEDNGIGIPREHQGRIFRAFERLHGEDSYPGTGIGLAIVQRGMERMGGAVGLESEPGRGSRFWIELPPAEALRSDPAPAPAGGVDQATRPSSSPSSAEAGPG